MLSQVTIHDDESCILEDIIRIRPCWSWVGVVVSSIGINSRSSVQSRVYPLAVDELDARVSKVLVMIGLVIGRRYSRMRKRSSPMVLYRVRPNRQVQRPCPKHWYFRLSAPNGMSAIFHLKLWQQMYACQWELGRSTCPNWISA